MNSVAELRAHCMELDEPELMAQQLVQQGARHAVATLLANGCSPAFARDMLDSLRRNGEVIGEVARAKGFSKLFETDTDELETRAWGLDQQAGEQEYASWNSSGNGGVHTGDGAERRIEAAVEKLRRCRLGCGPFGQCKAAMNGVPNECANSAGADGVPAAANVPSMASLSEAASIASKHMPGTSNWCAAMQRALAASASNAGVGLVEGQTVSGQVMPKGNSNER